MHHIISPTLLNENSFEFFINQIPAWEKNESNDILIDMGFTESIDSYSLLGLLHLGICFKKNNCNTSLNLPKNDEVLRFIYDSDFFRYASVAFDDIMGKKTDCYSNENILLKITPVSQSADIHDVVLKIRQSVSYEVLQEHTYFWDNIIVIVSEICQNIHEHSQDKGFVMLTQSLNKHSRKSTIRMVVMDTGIGIKSSLDKKFFPIFRGKWSDHMAIQKTLFEGVSRHDDPGRGNGIIRTRQLVAKFHGNMSLRSGTAKLWGNIPSWEIERVLRKPLTFLPGTQVNISLPLGYPS